VAAPLFGVWIAVRMDPMLLFLDGVAAAGLLLVGASRARSGAPTNLPLPNLAGRGVLGLVHGILAPGFALGGLRSDRGDERPTGSGLAYVRGGLLAAPLVFVVLALLASADPVFASFLRFPDDVGDLVVHAVLLTIGAWGAAAVLRMASAPPFGPPGLAGANRPMGDVEAATVLGGLVLVFAAFAVSQAVAVIGGADYVLRTAGLGYGEYARHGFFQLLAVAAITLVVVIALRATVRTPTSRRFVVLAELAAVLTLVLVAGAVRRLRLYDLAYGLTPLRLWALLFAVWIGVVFVLLAVSLTGRVAPTRAWFVPAAIAAGLAGLLVVNAANPDAWIVRRNVDRFGADSARLDVGTLLTLSDDAVPTLLDALPQLSPDDASRVLQAECAAQRQTDGGFWAFNRSTQRAVDARNDRCPETRSGP
jgi:hypothetical protein